MYFYEKLGQNINFTIIIKFSLFHTVWCLHMKSNIVIFLRVTKFGLMYGMELVMNEFE